MGAIKRELARIQAECLHPNAQYFGGVVSCPDCDAVVEKDDEELYQLHLDADEDAALDKERGLS